jgi:glycosyltransferase involved in cell wall biosynthesis
MRLTIVTSHPIQYQAPLFRRLASEVELTVFFAHRASAKDQAAAGFNVPFDWDIDLLSGYRHHFLSNLSRSPGVNRFGGCDTPEIGRQLDAIGCDAVLVTGWYLKSFWQAIWAAKVRGIPILVRGDSHLRTPRSRVKRAMKQLAYPVGLRCFRAALYVGKRSREYYEYYHVQPDRLFFSPHCVDTHWFAERATLKARHDVRARLSIGGEEKVLLFVGRLLELKRPLDVIHAAARLRQMGSPVSVLMAGSGPLFGRIQREAIAAKVPIHMLGFQNQTRLPAIYAAADILVLPSESETWGLVANEALACGKPIVVSDAVGCAPDLAADNLAGREFPVGNCDRFASAMHDLIARPPKPDAIAAKAKAYGLTAAAEGIVKALQTILSPECAR